MKKYLYKITCVLLAVTMLFDLSVTAAAETYPEINLRYLSGWPAGPELGSRSAFLIELNSGEVLYTKNEDEKRYPASITKVMTALVVIENCRLDEEVVFSHAAVTDLEEGGYNGYYHEGESLTVEQCLYALLLESVNECGYALAEHVAGSVPAFADMMNARAAELGCTNTHFNNPHGLNDEEHYTTAHDMGRIFRACLQNDTFMKIDSTMKYHIDPTELNPEGFNLTMHHKMMIEGSEYYYPEVKAGKTGYTSIAKNTLVTYAEKDGVELICVVMKGEGGGAIYSDTKKLLDYGFGKFSLVDMTENTENFVNGLNMGNAIPVRVEGSSSFYLPAGTEGLTMGLEKKGAFDDADVIGNIVFSCGDEKLSSLPLLIDSEALGSSSAAGETVAEGAESTENNADGSESAAESAVQTEVETETETAIATRREAKENNSRTVITVLIIAGIVLLAAIGFIFFRRMQAEKARKKRRREIIERMRKGRDEE